MTIRVAVLGAAGRMGAETCRAVDGDPDLELVARLGRTDPLSGLVDAGAQVAVDFTRADAVVANVRFCLDNGIHAVVGTTGIGDDDLVGFGDRARATSANVVVAPNFAIGAVLMMRFAASAARFFDAAEIVERHHEGKLDAPSGTALRTAATMNDARAEERWASAAAESSPARGLDVDGIRIHSIRAPGHVAHQEVVLASAGQALTIRHDSLDRTSFMPGVLLAVKRVGSTPGLTVGLEHLLDL